MPRRRHYRLFAAPRRTPRRRAAARTPATPQETRTGLGCLGLVVLAILGIATLGHPSPSASPSALPTLPLPTHVVFATATSPSGTTLNAVAALPTGAPATATALPPTATLPLATTTRTPAPVTRTALARSTRTAVAGVTRTARVQATNIAHYAATAETADRRTATAEAHAAQTSAAIFAPPVVAPSGGRIGAICRDGTRSNATGRGACSHHGGVDHWLYGP